MDTLSFLLVLGQQSIKCNFFLIGHCIWRIHEGENAKIAIRNIRRDANHHIKDLLKEKEISEDDDRRAEQEIQNITDANITKVDEIVAEKEQELLEI